MERDIYIYIYKSGKRKSRTARLNSFKNKKKKEVNITAVDNFPWVVVVVLKFLIRDSARVPEWKLREAIVP